jgi:hypothetical protein
MREEEGEEEGENYMIGYDTKFASSSSSASIFII